MEAGLGHLFLAYCILNVVWTFILKGIYDINDRMSKKLEFEKDAFDNPGYGPLLFFWLGPIGSIAMIIFTIPAAFGLLIMVIDTIDYIWNRILNLVISNKNVKNS